MKMTELTLISERETAEYTTQSSPLLLPSIVVLIPSLNEAGSIGDVLKEVQANLSKESEIIVVDNSTDDTPIVAAGHGARVLTQAGQGKGDALRLGFANSGKSDIILMMDADGSMRAEEIPILIRALETEGVDVAKGSRFLSGGGSTDLSRIRRIGNKLFISMVNFFWHGQYTDLCYGFIAFKAEALKKLAPLLESEHFQIETEICIKARKLGLNVVEVPSLELRRKHGISKLNGIRDSVRIMSVIIEELFSGI